MSLYIASDVQERIHEFEEGATTYPFPVPSSFPLPSISFLFRFSVPILSFSRPRPVARRSWGGLIEAPRGEAGWGVGRGCPLSTGEGSGEGLEGVCPLPRKFWDFHLKWLILVQIPLYILTQNNVRLFTARTTTVTVYCWRLTGSSYWEGFWGRGCDPYSENFGTFSLEMAHFLCKFSCILTDMLAIYC